MNRSISPIQIFYSITILLSFEFIELFNTISIFQIFIFPLCLLGLFLMPSFINRQFISLFILTSISLILFIFSNYENNFISLILFSFGVFVFILYLTVFFSNYEIDKNFIFITSFYSLPHLLFFLFNFFSNNLILKFTGSANERFHGLHNDPNFMCVYINIAIASKMFLFYIFKLKTFKKNLILILLILDFIMILFSISRAGIIISLISFVYFLIFYNKISLFKIVLISSFIFYFFYNLFINLKYEATMNVISSIMWRQKQSINNFGFQDTRIDSLNNIYNLIVSNKIIFLGFPIDKYLEIYHYYPHNTFLDIILNNGFIFGLILILFIIFKFIFLLQSFSNKNYIFKYWVIQLLIVSFLSYLFLSMYHEKIFWFTISLLFYFYNYNNKNSLNYV